MLGVLALNYRQATEDDLTRLAEMRWDFRTESGSINTVVGKDEFIKNCTDFLGKGLLEQRWVYWIAENQEGIVGHVFVQRVSKVPKPESLSNEYGYVANVYTIPSHRRRRICSELIKKVIAWAEDQGLDVLIVWPSEESVGFYEKAGFSRKTLFWNMS